MLVLLHVLVLLEVLCLLKMLCLLEMVDLLEGGALLASGIFITAFFHALNIFNSITLFTRNATLREGYKGRRKAGLLLLINILRFFVRYATCVGITKTSVKYYLDFPDFVRHVHGLILHLRM